MDNWQLARWCGSDLLFPYGRDARCPSRRRRSPCGSGGRPRHRLTNKGSTSLGIAQVATLRARGRLEHLRRAEAAPDEQPPRADVAHCLHHGAAPVEERRVDRKAHEAGVYAVAARYQHSRAGREAATPDEPAHPLEQGLRDLGVDPVYDHPSHGRKVSRAGSRWPARSRRRETAPCRRWQSPKSRTG